MMILESPTSYPELNMVLKELVERVQNILVQKFVGAYLQGSFAVGDADERSDVDFMVIIKEELTEKEVQDLEAMHSNLYEYDSEWAKHLEGSYIPLDLLNRAEIVGIQKLWYIDNGSRVLELSDHDNQWVVRWVLREHGVALAGPESKSLMEPILESNLKGEVRKVMLDWGKEMLDNPEKLKSRWYQHFAVMSYCRMLQTLDGASLSTGR